MGARVPARWPVRAAERRSIYTGVHHLGLGVCVRLDRLTPWDVLLNMATSGVMVFSLLLLVWG